MGQPKSMVQNRQVTYNNDTIETLKSAPSNMAKNTLKAFGDIGTGIGQSMLDAFTGGDFSSEHSEQFPERKNEQIGNFQKKVEFNRLYDFQAEQEKQTIKELLKKIHEEVVALKNANSALAQEVKDVEKLTLSSANEKPGVYHIRFLELVLSFLRTMRAKISESSTWLEALQSKKKKRGSAFAVNSKSKGTQYSMSEEMKVVRSTQ